MKLSEFKNQLEFVTQLEFVLQNGQKVPSHFHITEISHFVSYDRCGDSDWGGNIRGGAAPRE